MKYENQYIFDGHRCAVIWKQIFFFKLCSLSNVWYQTEVIFIMNLTADHVSGPAPTFRS